MKALLCALPLLLLAACITKDDTDEVCTSGCTIIQGRITTAGGAPVEGIKLEVRSLTDPKGLATTRKIAIAHTDAAGNYRLQFALNDKEGGPSAVATVYLKYNYDSDRYLPLGGNHADVPISAPWMSIRPFENKEVTLTKDIYLPLKSTVALRMDGLVPPVNYDDNFFKVTAFCRGGIDAPMVAAYEVLATANPMEAEMAVAGDDSVTFRIERRKPGNRILFSDTTLWVPVAGGRQLRLSY